MTDESERGRAAVPSRRLFLAGLLAPAAAAVLAPAPARALLAFPERALRLHNRHLGEEVRTVYFADGRYDRRGLGEIRRLMRDKRSGEQTEIDLALLDLFWGLQRRLAPHGSLEVVCGYRSPQTNAILRRTTRGVAPNSFHMYGKAADLRIPGVPLAYLHRAALDLGVGGVGYYPRANFVHVDTGPVRTWGGGRAVASATPAKGRGARRGGRSVAARTAKAGTRRA